MYRFDVISKAIFNKQSNVYISGIAGSGKSYLLRQQNLRLYCTLKF